MAGMSILSIVGGSDRSSSAFAIVAVAIGLARRASRPDTMWTQGDSNP